MCESVWRFRRLEGHSPIEKFCSDVASLVPLGLVAAVGSMEVGRRPILEGNMQVEVRRAVPPVTHDLLPSFAKWHPIWHVGNDRP